MSFYQDLFFHFHLQMLIQLVSPLSFLQINVLTQACGLQQESHFKVVWFQDNAGSGPNQQQTLPEDDVDPELARYLNRSYWEQRQSEEAQHHEKQIHHVSDRNGGRVGSPLSQQPSAPMSSLTISNKIVSGSTNIVLNLDDWLTVHHSITIVNFQLDAQNSYLFIYNTFIKILYMFWALPCSSSGGLRHDCIYAASGIVTVCRWLSCAPVGKELNRCIGQSPAESDDTRGCMYTITT